MNDDPCKNLRLAQTCFSGSWGGLEMSTLKWTSYFQHAGIYSPCLCKSGSPLHQQLIQEKLQHIAFPVATKYFSPGLKRTIAATCRNERIDILISHRSSDLWHIAPMLWGRPISRLVLVSRILSSTVDKTDWFHRQIYRKLDAVIVLSQLGKDFFIAMTRMAPEKIHVIPNGITIEKYVQARGLRQQYRAEFGLSPDEIVVVLVGRIDPLKGHLEFIQALSNLKKHYPGIRAYIVGERTRGEWDDYFATLEKTIATNQLGDVVQFLGYRPDVENIYSIADICIMPSYAEAFGNVLLEAMASRVPVIATNTGAPPEILDHGKYGILIAPKSAGAIEKALSDLIGDSARREQLSRLGFDRVKTTYQLNIVMKQVIDLCCGLK
ncbi:MAG: glycosyltransferase family 4 protein [Candidatus Zhuqueibacterota bacterium]